MDVHEKCLIDTTIGIAVYTDYWTEILKTVDAVPIEKSAMDIDPNAGKSFQKTAINIHEPTNK